MPTWPDQHATSAAFTAAETMLPEERARVRAVLVLGGVGRADIDDATQQVQLRLLEHLRSDRQPLRHRDAWLCVVASRIAMDWHRAQAKKKQLSERMAAWAPQSAPDEDDRVLAILVAELLEQLPPDQRQLLILRYYVDLTVPEIARHLGIPAGTVKSRLHAAMCVARDTVGARISPRRE